MIRIKFSLAIVVGLALPSLAFGEAIDFTTQVKPILESTCVNCHGPDDADGDLRLDTRAHALKGGDSGPSLVPGKPNESTLYTLTILPEDDDEIMPPKGAPLAKSQTDILKKWRCRTKRFPISAWRALGGPARRSKRAPNGSPDDPRAPKSAPRSHQH